MSIYHMLLPHNLIYIDIFKRKSTKKVKISSKIVVIRSLFYLFATGHSHQYPASGQKIFAAVHEDQEKRKNNFEVLPRSRWSNWRRRDCNEF